MMRVQRAAERYPGGDGAGIDTRHAFSFNQLSYDAGNLRFGPLMACNEERLAPGAGYSPHGHRDVEIVTWVAEGELSHEDSAGNRTLVRPGDVQRLSAGSGVRHAERNLGGGPLRFVQMWLATQLDDLGRPYAGSAEPQYEVVRGIADSTPYALSRTDAVLHVRRLADGEPTAVPDARWAYLHVVRGTVRLSGELLAEGDSARVDHARDLVAEAVGDAEFLVWEMAEGPLPG